MNRFPLHDAGPDIIDSLNKIPFPIDDYKDATSKLLKGFNSSLIEVIKWFAQIP